MMTKLVIKTKNPETEIFVTDRLSFDQVSMIQKFGIPFLTKLFKNIDYWTLCDDYDDSLIEVDHPWFLNFSKKYKSWTAVRLIKNNEHPKGYYEGFVCKAFGKREHYTTLDLAA
ncbi:MAG: hypothetical protein VW683_02690 [Betaproteobacteria bacterium]